MPIYIRYGYVTTQTIKMDDRIESSTNIAFHLNPQLAQENVDTMVHVYKNRFATTQVVEDTTVKDVSGLLCQVIRCVLIKYLDGSTATITIERWGTKVGRE